MRRRNGRGQRGLDGKAKVRIRARAGAYPMTLEKDTWILEPRKSVELVVLLKNKGNPSSDCQDLTGDFLVEQQQ